jgi:DNA-binding transcriptional MerR regulator
MWRRYLTWLAAVFLAGLTAYGEWRLYDAGKLQGAEELKSLRAEHIELRGQLRDLRKQNASLQERSAMLERSSQIDQQAARDVQEQLESLQEKLRAAREEVEFYRGIIVPGDAAAGLRIHRFEIAPGQQPGEYHYDLVLTQVKRHDRIVTGKIQWRIIGKDEGATRELNLSDVTQPAVKQLRFRFRYFQHLTGVLTLPAGFQAREVVLSVVATGKDAVEPVEESFEWSESGS